MASESLMPDRQPEWREARRQTTISQVFGPEADRRHNTPTRQSLDRARVERARGLLSVFREEQVRLDAGLDDAVAIARRADVSWEQIAAELRISRQAALERWRRVDTSPRCAAIRGGGSTRDQA
jgi:hypothetical protein